MAQNGQNSPKTTQNMTEDFSPKALVVVERLLELLGKGGVANSHLFFSICMTG